MAEQRFVELSGLGVQDTGYEPKVLSGTEARDDALSFSGATCQPEPETTTEPGTTSTEPETSEEPEAETTEATTATATTTEAEEPERDPNWFQDLADFWKDWHQKQEQAAATTPTTSVAEETESEA